MASYSFHHHHHPPYPNHHLQSKPNVQNSKLCMLSRSTPGVEALPTKCTQYVSYPSPTYTKQRLRSGIDVHAMSTPSSQEEEEGEVKVRGLRLSLPSPPPSLLKIGILGFGNFGQFIGRGIQRHGHIVLATSRYDYSDYCRQHGIQFFRSVEMMCEEQPDVILVCSSILSTENVVRGIPTNKLNPDTVFVDVLSVKQFPRNLFLEVLPPEFGILCTHPMFGPESGKHGWQKLPFVYDKVRLTNSLQERTCADFLSIFEKEGCRMVEMSCEEHDHHAAGSQFITHTIGRILSHLDLESTPINTKGYKTLLQLTENTVSDSFDLYYGLFMYNVNATEQKLKTSVKKGCLNPKWKEDLTLSISEHILPIRLEVFDKDTFTKDDKMGDAQIDIQPLLYAVKMGVLNVPNGTAIRRVQPSRENCLSDESAVVWNTGGVLQDMILRLKNVECGEIEIQLQWVNVPGAKGL